MSLAAASFQFRLLEQGLSLSFKGMSVCGWSTKRQALVVNRMEAQRRQREEREGSSALLVGLPCQVCARLYGEGPLELETRRKITPRSSGIVSWLEDQKMSGMSPPEIWLFDGGCHIVYSVQARRIKPLRHSKRLGRRQMPSFGQQDEVYVLPIVLSQPGRQLVTLINAALH